MSHLIYKLSAEQTGTPENYENLVAAIFGDGAYPQDNAQLSQAVNDVLCDLRESNPLGALQTYFVEQYFLCGKSKEAIGKEIADNMELLLSDLERTSLRFLRHPARSKALAPYTIKVEK